MNLKRVNLKRTTVGLDGRLFIRFILVGDDADIVPQERVAPESSRPPTICFRLFLYKNGDFFIFLFTALNNIFRPA